ncbi:HAD domain-containing protein [Streptomyces drozdowiczii]|uniref:HAD domain-containing protein n=1 Tax=Streptomyces drozdowiczii TaxID=202862 RepID=UPI002245111B|nr:HAD domain-containing protein [Streptomyces drozdowiczii]MCX0242368.1 hypothetical protein [Streptomyces drozdowiczii]
MTAPDPLPLLFLDVDGPLIPFGARPGGHRTYPMGPVPPGAAAHPLLTRVDPSLGPRLGALPCTLVWATTWEDEANTVLGPRLGLPVLDVVAWPDAPEQEARDARAGLHWKTRPLVEWAAGRAFAWVDDEIGGPDRRWVAGHHGGPALLHRVDPVLGLTGADLRLVEGWLRAV